MNLGKTGDVNMGHFCPTSARGVECNYCGHCHIYDPTIDEKIETYAQPQPGERAQTGNQDQLPRGVIQGNQPAAYDDYANYADDADYDDDVDFDYYGYHDAHNSYHDDDDDAVYYSHPEDHPPPAHHYYEDGHGVHIPRSQSGHYDRPDEHHYDGRYGAINHTIQPARHRTQDKASKKQQRLVKRLWWLAT